MLRSKADDSRKNVACGQWFGSSCGSSLSQRKEGVISAHSALCEFS